MKLELELAIKLSLTLSNQNRYRCPKSVQPVAELNRETEEIHTLKKNYH